MKMGIPLRYDIKMKQTTVDYEFGNVFRPTLNYFHLSATYNLSFYIYPRIFPQKKQLIQYFSPLLYPDIVSLGS